MPTEKIIAGNRITDADPLQTQDAGAALGATVLGAVGDAIVAVGAVGTLSAKLRRATQGLEDLKSLIVLGAGANLIGSVRVPYVAQALHPFGKGLLTADGQQYSPLVTTVGDDFEAVETVTITAPTGMTLVELGFGLTMAIQSSGAGESVIYKWQGSDAGAVWVDLNTAITRAASAAALLDVTVSGIWAPIANFLGSGATFQLRAMIKSGGAGGETAKGKTKSSSWILPIWRY